MSITKKKHILPCPTVELIEKACKEFDDNPDNKLKRSALNLLLLTFPENAVESHVLLKVLAIDTIMKTRVQSIHVGPLALHLVAQKVDSLFAKESLNAVELISKCHGLHRYYSFATKYCSWHKPGVYPIYDRNVVECLWRYNTGIETETTCKHSFTEQFKGRSAFENKLKVYTAFVKVMGEFRTHYDLGSLCFRQIDKFLWAEGDPIIKEAKAAQKRRKAIKKAAAK